MPPPDALRRSEPARPRLLPLLVAWTAVVAVAVGIHVMIAAPADAQAEQRGAREDPPLVDGELLWKRDCVSCHGADATGTPWGPSLQGKGAAGVHLSITTGRMPMELIAPLSDEPFDEDRMQVLPDHDRASEYLPEQIDALTAYASEIVGGPPVTEVDLASGDLSSGQVLFQANCAACHVWSGRGGTLAHGSVATSLERSTPENVVAAMRTGIGTMPVFHAEVISDEQATDIAAYVEYLKSPANPGGQPLSYIGPAAEGFVAWVVGLLGIVLIARWIGGHP